MLIYNLIYTALLIGIFIKSSNKVFAKYWFWLSSALIVGSIAFRHVDMGPDTYNYLQYFLHPDSRITKYQKEEIELGLTILNRLLGLFIENQYVYNFVFSILVLSPIIYLIRRYSKNAMLSLFLFVSFSVGISIYFLAFAAMRQMMAMALFCLLLDRFVKNNCKIDRGFYVLFFLMVMCHYSSMLTALLFLSYKFEFRKNTLVVIVLTSALIGYVIKPILPWFMFLAESVNKGFYFTSLHGVFVYSIVPSLPYVGLYLSIIYCLKEKDCNSLWMKGLLCAVVLGNLLSFGNNIDRICAYFYILSIIAIPNAITISLKSNRLIVYSLLLCLLCYFTYKYYYPLTLDDGVWTLVPYKSCFD